MTNVFRLTLKASQEAGKISTRNSKMPGTSFAISAKRCNVGSRLVNVKGSTCAKCYALKLQKLRPSVDKGWELNYSKAVAMIESDPDQWVKSMVFQLVRAKASYHRWFDSGDIASIEMLKAIVMVAEQTPDIRHWLPTREVSVVAAYIREHGAFPSNLVVRVSAPMVDQKPLSFSNTSTVHKTSEPVGHVCPASQQGNSCGDCRACWDHGVPNVSYPLH